LSDRALRFCVGALASAGLVTGTHLRALRRRLDHVHDRRLRDRRSPRRHRRRDPGRRPGLLGYAAILATAFLVSDAARSAGAALALGAFAFSATRCTSSSRYTDAVCDWCLVSDAIVAVLVPFTLLRLSAASRRPAR
jgi:hypothetical protein